MFCGSGGSFLKSDEITMMMSSRLSLIRRLQTARVKEEFERGEHLPGLEDPMQDAIDLHYLKCRIQCFVA